MDANITKTLKSGVWYTVSNFCLKGIVFLTTPIFTRLLTQAEYGIFSNFTSWLNILMVITTLNVEATLISARYEYEDKLDGYIKSVLLLSLLSTTAWWMIVSFFMDKVQTWVDMPALYIHLMFGYLFTLPAINLFQTRERFFYRYKISVALSMTLSIGSSLLSVVLVILMSDSLTGRIVGYVLPNVIIGGALVVYLFRVGGKIVITYWKEALKIVLPFIPHLLSLTMLNQTDRIMITKICGETDTALYSLAYNVAMIITLLLTSLNGAFSPWLGEKLAMKDYLTIRKISKRYTMLFIYFAIGIMLFAPEILLILGGKKYIEAKWLMIPIAMGCICQFIYTLFVNVEQFEKKTVGMAYASISAAVLNLVLNAWLIPKYGYVAAAYTTLIGYLWLLLVHMYLVYRIKMSRVYSYRFIVIAVCTALIIACFIGGLYQFLFARYLVAVIYIIVTLVFVWHYKGRILELVKK